MLDEAGNDLDDLGKQHGRIDIQNTRTRQFEKLGAHLTQLAASKAQKCAEQGNVADWPRNDPEHGTRYRKL